MLKRLTLVEGARRLGAGQAGGAGLAGAQGPERTVPVTPSFSLTDETVQQAAVPACEPFVDWLTISQEHPEGVRDANGELIVVEGGAVMSIDDEGEVEWRTGRWVKHEGSYSTSVNVRCDGHRVILSGNLSRLGRTDNVFGFSLMECVSHANQVLAAHGLPPFTDGECYREFRKGHVETKWSGARISRLDITGNFETGSEQNARALVQWLGTQRLGRFESRTYEGGETVEWGRGSAHQYWKLYIKHVELVKHMAKAHKRQSAMVDADRLVNHCKAVGMVRFEGTIRGKSLARFASPYLADFRQGWAMAEVVKLFHDRSAVLTRADRVMDGFDNLPRHIRGVARDYLAGRNVREDMSKATFYRNRTALLPFGIDIAVPSAVRQFTPRVQVISLRPAQIPEWYTLAAA